VVIRAEAVHEQHRPPARSARADPPEAEAPAVARARLEALVAIVEHVRPRHAAAERVESIEEAHAPAIPRRGRGYSGAPQASHSESFLRASSVGRGSIVGIEVFVATGPLPAF